MVFGKNKTWPIKGVSQEYDPSWPKIAVKKGPYSGTGKGRGFIPEKHHTETSFYFLMFFNNEK